MGYKIIGNDDSAEEIYKNYGKYPVIVSPDLPLIRKKLVRHYSEIGFKFCNLISPQAFISVSARIGNGVVIQTGVNISANSVIGDFVKLNTYSNVMHDCEIKKYSTIAPNAVILGKVRVMESCYIGANSTILPGITIGENSTIGAGAVVTKDIDASIIAAGNPARKLKK